MTNKENFENPEVIVPEIANEVIDNFFVTNDGLFYTTTKNGVEAKLYISKNNTAKEIELPFKSGKIDAGILSKYSRAYYA